MPSLTDLIGQKIHHLTIVEILPSKPYVTPKGRRTAYRMVRCECDCGQQADVRLSELLGGRKKACGCILPGRKSKLVSTSGYSHHPLYKVWLSMLHRCDNPEYRAYPNYGGRGIKVCDRWYDFEAFVEDVGEAVEGMSLDRIDNNGNYEPGNVRYTTPTQQSRNRRSNTLLTFQGTTHCLAEWAEIKGMKNNTLMSRLNKGWSIENALTTPVGSVSRWSK